MNRFDPTRPIELREKVPLAIIVHQRGSLLFIHRESGLYRLLFVVAPLDEFAAAPVADAGVPGRVQLDMKYRLTLRAAPPAGQTPDQFIAGDDEIDDAIKPFPPGPQQLSQVFGQSCGSGNSRADNSLDVGNLAVTCN